MVKYVLRNFNNIDSQLNAYVPDYETRSSKWL